MKSAREEDEEAASDNSTGPQLATKPERHRLADEAILMCPATPPHACVTACIHSGKVGKNRNSGAIGPTMFWLTCPNINAVLGHYERHGAVSAVAALLSSSESLKRQHEASHDRYLELVLPRLPTEEKESFLRSFVNCTPRKYGNAGVAGIHDVKCLHALVAGALAGDQNPLGRMIALYLAAEGQRYLDVTAPADKIEDEVPSLIRALSGGFQGPAPLDPVLPLLCKCSLALFTALEGHAPHMRKKRRIN